MDPQTADTPLDPDHARRITAILSIQPDGSQPLTQFNPTQREAYEWAVKWIHDFNLGRMPKPNFSDEVLGRLSDFHETQMNEHFRQNEAAAAPLPTPPTNSARDCHPTTRWRNGRNGCSQA